LPPGGVDYAQVTVRNDGNGPDTFALSTVGLPEGWNFTFEQPTVTVGDNQTAGVRAKIEAPPHVDAGSTFGFLVRVASDGAPPQVLNFTLNVTQVYGLTVDIVPPKGEVAAGSVVEVPISAQNLGNGVDDVVIEIHGPPNWLTALTRTRLALLPYSNLTSTARITVDRNALAGNYTFNLSFSGANINTSRLFNITVQQVYILEVNGPETTLRMDQGKTILIDVNVTNLGNGPAKVTPASSTPDGLSLIASEDFLVIDANGTVQFSFQLVATRSLPAGLYNFTMDFKTGATGNRSNPLTVRVDVRAVAEQPGPDDQTPRGADSSVLYMVLGVAVAAAIALPIGLLFLRRRAAAQVPEPGVIVQTEDDVNAGPGYQPEVPESPPAAPPAHHGPQPPPVHHGPQPPQRGPAKGPRGPNPPH
jgi:uncharacterized membrane protein